MILLGPRQVGKTTLALAVGGGLDSLYLDLESELDLAKLGEPELYLARHQDKLVILDEIQRAPSLFLVLRGLIDRGRRRGRANGQYLLLGSASMELMQQSSESLAGRVSTMELHPFHVLEMELATAAGQGTLFANTRLWSRGGFPESYLATTDAKSLRWRRDFIRTYLERDIPQLGPRVAAESLRRLWVMLAHHQGGLLNAAQLARSLDVSGSSVLRYVDLLVDLLLVRRLPPWHTNIGKRLTRSPKIFVRDSGLVHALLGIQDTEALLSHPVLGASWEGFVIENLSSVTPSEVEASFYRTSGGAEIDLLLRFPGGELWAIEIKRSLKPSLGRGFHSACADLQPTRKFVVHAGETSFPMKNDVLAISLNELAQRLAALD